MSKALSGPLVTGMIVAGVAAILIFNIQPGRPKSQPIPADSPPGEVLARTGAEEHPIGDPVEKNHLRVAAVWLSAVQMEGMAAASADSTNLIHLEADIKALADNPNGFAKDEFVPYLKIAFSISPLKGGPPIASGELSPMVAWDGLHYGANIPMPKSGDYRMTYEIEPPSAGGLGRHSDPATGVAVWWKPFQANFEWTIEPAPAAVVNSR